MPGLFVIHSTPVRMPDGGFSVMVGTVAGVDIKRFVRRDEADSYQKMLVSSLRCAVEVPFEYVLIDSETEYLPLKDKFDREYDRLSAQQPSPPAHLAFSVASLKKIAARVSGSWR